MAAGSGADKENAAPSTTAATAGPRRHSHGVKSCGVKKRPSRARLLGRMPLRDITNLVAANSVVAEPEAPLEQEVSAAAVELPKPDAVVPAVARVAAVHHGSAAGPAAKKAPTVARRSGRGSDRLYSRIWR